MLVHKQRGASCTSLVSIGGRPSVAADDRSIVSRNDAFPRSPEIDPDALIELAQSEFGLVESTADLCELCWAVAAHCAARGHPGDWSMIEVPAFLDAVEHGYERQERLRILRGWSRLIAWMHELGLLRDELFGAYRDQTRSWLLERVRLGRALELILWEQH